MRDKFTKKLHKAEDVLKLPLEYLGIFALAAPEPVKERKTQVKYCKVQHFEKMKTRTRLTDVCGIKALKSLTFVALDLLFRLDK